MGQSNPVEAATNPIFKRKSASRTVGDMEQTTKRALEIEYRWLQSRKSYDGRGVLRNEHGEFVYGFSHQYTHSEIIHAELQAIIDGLIYIQLMGLENVDVETDLGNAFHLIKKE